MSVTPLIRSAERYDLDRLVALENNCFDGDRLSRRSFRRFIESEQADLFVAFVAERIEAYILVLYRSGTNLARIYSLAVTPEVRGRGLARELLRYAELIARERDAGFLRLEVDIENRAAIALYTGLGYHSFGQIAGYYDNGHTAVRMEKAVRPVQRPEPATDYYKQTTPFSCGPASLMMAMHQLNSDYQMSRSEELKIWRESTTIYMTSGHGGCSPVGLALAAAERGFKAEVYLSNGETPFLESVRDNAKRSVIEQVHSDYLKAATTAGISVEYQSLSGEQLIDALRAGRSALCLISTWRLNRNRAPHWVLASAADDAYLYICDPDHDEDDWHPESDFVDVPIRHTNYAQLARYGRNRLSSTVLVG